MQSLCLFFIIALVLQIEARHETQNLPLGRNPKEVIERKCYVQSGGSITDIDELQNAKKGISETLISIVEGSTDDPVVGLKTFCKKSAQEALYSALQNMTKALTKCLDDEEAFFEDFILKTYRYAMEDFCSDEGFLKVIDFMQSLQTNSCNLESYHGLLKKCVLQTDFYKMMAGQEEFILKANHMCRDIELVKECGSETITVGCLQDLGDTARTMLHPALRWCKEQV